MKNIFFALVLVFCLNLFGLKQDSLAVKKINPSLPILYKPIFPQVKTPSLSNVQQMKKPKSPIQFDWQGKLGFPFFVQMKNVLSLDKFYDMKYDTAIDMSLKKKNHSHVFFDIHATSSQFKQTYLNAGFGKQNTDFDDFSVTELHIENEYKLKSIPLTIYSGWQYFAQEKRDNIVDLNCAFTYVMNIKTYDITQKIGHIRDHFFYLGSMEVPLDFQTFEVALMLDRDGIMPGLTLEKEFTFPYLNDVIAFQKSTFQLLNRQEIWKKNPYSTVNYERHFTKTPVHIGLAKLLPEKQSAFSTGIAFHQNDLVWIYHPDMAYESTFCNTMETYLKGATKGHYQGWNYILDGTLKWHYIVEENGMRKPYEPVCEINSKFAYPFSKVLLKINSEMKFTAIDSFEEKRPIVLNTSIMLQKEWQNIQWQIGIDNVLGSRTSVFNKVPETYPTFFISFEL